MTSDDALPAVLRGLRDRAAQLPGTGARVGSKRFERYLRVIVAVFALLYAAQANDSLVADWPAMADPVGGLVITLVIGSVVIGLVPAFLPGRARSFFVAAVVVFCIGAALWPFSVHATVPASTMPWLAAVWPSQVAYLIALSKRAIVPLGTSVVVAAWVGVSLLTVGRMDAGDVVANVLFMVAVSAVLHLLVHAVRRSMDRAESAAQTALVEYGRSRFDDAAETERVRTDALVHDAVLTTFLSAANAREPETQDLSRRMAANALRVLAHVNRSAELGPAVPFRLALAEASSDLEGLLPHFVLRSAADDVVLPVTAADALVGAMLHAMANSVQHAGGSAVRTVVIDPLGPDGVRVVVADDGRGFDLAAATEGRLGIRLAVVDRMRRVDGRADVDTAPGGGTTVTLSWGSVVVFGTAPLEDSSAGAVRA